MIPRVAFLIPATLVALPLSLYADVVGWTCDKCADLAEPASEFLAESAETARWLARVMRAVP